MSPAHAIRYAAAATLLMSRPERLMSAVAAAALGLSAASWAQGHGLAWLAAALTQAELLGQVVVTAIWRQQAAYWCRRARQEALAARLARTRPWPPLGSGTRSTS
jgi:hypothetical protein